jgi:hypothetical protein
VGEGRASNHQEGPKLGLRAGTDTPAPSVALAPTTGNKGGKQENEFEI